LDWWLVALGSALALFLTAFFWPFRLSLSLQARGGADGTFAAAGGAQIGPVTATLVVARGVPLNIGVQLFGRALNRSPKQPKPQSEPEPEPESDEPSGPRPAPRWLRKLASRLELSQVVDYLFGKRRWIGLDGLEVDFDYSSRNVALTGQILAALCAASAFLPAKVTLRHNPSWELVDRASLSVDGRFRLRPGLFVCDTLWFLMRTFMLPKRSAAAAA